MRLKEKFYKGLGLGGATVVWVLALLTFLMAQALTAHTETEANKTDLVCEKAVAGDLNENYVIVPITTELQQLESSGEDTLVCVLINGGIFQDSDPDPKVFNMLPKEYPEKYEAVDFYDLEEARTDRLSRHTEVSLDILYDKLPSLLSVGKVSSSLGRLVNIACVTREITASVPGISVQPS